MASTIGELAGIVDEMDNWFLPNIVEEPDGFVERNIRGFSVSVNKLNYLLTTSYHETTRRY